MGPTGSHSLAGLERDDMKLCGLLVDNISQPRVSMESLFSGARLWTVTLSSLPVGVLIPVVPSWDPMTLQPPSTARKPQVSTLRQPDAEWLLISNLEATSVSAGRRFWGLQWH